MGYRAMQILVGIVVTIASVAAYAVHKEGFAIVGRNETRH